MSKSCLSFLFLFFLIYSYTFNMDYACILSCFSCIGLCDPMDCSLPGSSVQEILQARILEWVAMPSSRESSPIKEPKRVSSISCIAGGLFFTAESLGKPNGLIPKTFKPLMQLNIFLKNLILRNG